MSDVAERLRALAEWQVLDTHGQWARDGANEVDAHRARADAAEAECARLRAELEASERARYAAEDERDAALELVAPDAVAVARQRDDRDAARLAALVTARVALADAELILEQRERQLREERARCAAVCREVAARYRHGACGCEECEGRGDGARECAEAIERGEVGR